jgi:hypothetical protein
MGAVRWMVPLLIWAAVRVAQVHIAGWGFGDDIERYVRYANAWGRGLMPYADYTVEYPPGALVLFLVPWLLGGPARFLAAFIGEMVAFDLLVVALLVIVAGRLFPDDRVRRWLVLALYLAATAVLQPVFYARFDLAPAALALAALLLVPSGGAWSPLLLGLAGSVKLWPLVLAPLWIGRAFRIAGSKGALREAALCAAGCMLPILPLLPRAGGHVMAFLAYHAARGLQVESTPGAVALALGRLGLGPSTCVYEFGAWDVTCAACPSLGWLSVAATLAMTQAPQVLALQAETWTERDPQGRTGLTAAAAAVSGLLAGGKVLSPQFLLWLAPLVVLTETTAAGLFVFAAALTSAVYPWLYQALLEPGARYHDASLALLLARNGLLCATYGVLVARLRRACRAALP